MRRPRAADRPDGMAIHLRRCLVASGGLLMAALMSSGCASPGSIAGPTAFPRAPVTSPPPGPAIDVPTAVVAAILDTAQSMLGVPYRLGGEDPAGFDCSGLVRYALGQHQVDVPRTVTEQFALGRPVAPDGLRPGDLVFFSTIGPGATHVGIVLEPAGESFVHAPSAGGVVRIERFDTEYWRLRFVGARRLF